METQYIINFEKFLQHRKQIHFVLSLNEVSDLGTKDMPDYIKNMYKFIFENIYDKYYILLDMTDEDIRDLYKNLPLNAVFYTYKPHSIFDDSGEKGKRITKILNLLSSRKDIHLFINNNYSGSKIYTQKQLNNKKFFIPGCFEKEDIESTIGFPVVAKPDFGHSGVGIKKIDNMEELNIFLNTIENKDDYIFTQFIDFKAEFRAFYVDQKLVYLAQRIDKEDKNISIRNKKSDDRMQFVYVIQDFNRIPFLKELSTINKEIVEIFPEKVYSLDFFLTKNDELKIIEINTQTGLDPYRLVILYESLYKFNYHTNLPIDKKTLIDDIKNIFINYSYNKYSNEIDKSFYPIDYKNIVVNSQLKKDLENYNSKILL